MKRISGKARFLSYIDDITHVFRFDIEKDGTIKCWDFIEYDATDDIPRIGFACIPLKITDSITGTCMAARLYCNRGDIEWFEYANRSEAYARLMFAFLFDPVFREYNRVYIICRDDELQKVIDTYPGKEVYVLVSDCGVSENDCIEDED